MRESRVSLLVLYQEKAVRQKKCCDWLLFIVLNRHIHAYVYRYMFCWLFSSTYTLIGSLTLPFKILNLLRQFARSELKSDKIATLKVR